MSGNAEEKKGRMAGRPVRGSMASSYAARMDAIRVPHDRFRKAAESIGRTIQYAGSLKEVPCRMFSGPAGVGKSTLAEALQGLYPAVPSREAPLDTDPDEPLVTAPNMPVVVLNMPTDPNPMNVCRAILEALGDPDFDVGTKASLEKRLERCIKHMGVCAILLDEAQRLVDRASVKAGQAILDWMKDRQARSRIVFILVGLGRLRNVFGDPQIWRRYDAVVRLLPYEWRDDRPESNDKDRADFLGLVKAVQRKSPLPFSKEVDVSCPEADLILVGKRFFSASQGRPGLLMKVLVNAAQQVDNGRAPPLITRELLAVAFDEAIGERPEWPNPFSNGWRGEMCPPVEDDFQPPDIFANRLPRRRGRRSRSSQLADARQSLRKR
ncbi:ATP-binding protein [Siccirubricoccus sp. KC 17139]|uniref:ATP-binding protein n=1 Tax=Siccirubricoccus soli TaxID=2899147 RepID=A0ABT1D1K3_9PROT|nr:ATP-binding protein [Siccirubricoccus soli]MCO6415790.1 ATP-binding protein [Siccirubricoccus soli]MCP2681922.1 ATP-binding protein [Siccirubricoccus soli]